MNDYFHVNPLSGNANKCSAQHRACPYGSKDEHYGNTEDARAGYEKLQEALAVRPRIPKAPAPSIVWNADTMADALDEDIKVQEERLLTWVGKGKTAGIERLVYLRNRRIALGSQATMDILDDKVIDKLKKHKGTVEDRYNKEVQQKGKASSTLYTANAVLSGFYKPIPAEAEPSVKKLVKSLTLNKDEAANEAHREFLEVMEKNKDARALYTTVKSLIIDKAKFQNFDDRYELANKAAVHAVSP